MAKRRNKFDYDSTREVILDPPRLVSNDTGLFPVGKYWRRVLSDNHPSSSAQAKFGD